MVRSDRAGGTREWSGRHSDENLNGGLFAVLEVCMSASTIAVIVLIALFIGGMSTLMILMNRPPKGKK